MTGTHPEHENPYPATHESARLESLERRVDTIDADRVHSAREVATLSEGQRALRDDMREMIIELRRTNETIVSVNSRVDESVQSVRDEFVTGVAQLKASIGRGVWAVVVLLVPTVVSLLGLWINA